MLGRYESRFLSAIDPAAPRALWIRHTSHRRPGATATGALWCTLFEPATRVDVAEPLLHLTENLTPRLAGDAARADPAPPKSAAA